METYALNEMVYVKYRKGWHLGRIQHVHGGEAYTVRFYQDGEQRLFVVGDAGERIKPYRSTLNHAYVRKVA